MGVKTYQCSICEEAKTVLHGIWTGEQWHSVYLPFWNQKEDIDLCDSCVAAVVNLLVGRAEDAVAQGSYETFAIEDEPDMTPKTWAEAVQAAADARHDVETDR
jgi:hypothetical protein